MFYRVVALWEDEISDEKQKEIPRPSVLFIEKNPKFFELPLFSSNSMKDLAGHEKQGHGSSGRKCGRLFIQLCIAPQGPI